MTRDPKKMDDAWKAFDEALRSDDGDTSWADDLPELPPTPQRPDETIAVFIPTRSDGRKTESE